MSGVHEPRRLCRVGTISIAAAVISAAAVLVPTASPAHAAGGLIISEVAPWASGNSPYAADWFELTNTGSTPLDVTGWKMDDSSSAIATAAPMSGITSIGAGESVIYLETSNLATVSAGFKTFWFGGTPPAGLQLGSYTGSGVGLSTDGDGVSVFDAGGALRAKVSFGAASASPYKSFDNAAGADNATISSLSAVGVNGAYSVPATTNPAVGSPGTIVNSATPPTTTPPTTAAPTTTVAPTGLAWPGSAAVQSTSTYVFNGNLSGLIEEGSGSPTPGVLWGVRNGPGSLFRMLWDGSKWSPDTANDWSNGKALRYPNGLGDPDAEGVTFAGTGSAAGIFVSTERDNGANSVSRLSVLRFDPTATGATLTATMEWDLTSVLPTVGPNLGLEAITWVPDSYLVANHFVDSLTGLAYVPADYPNHAGGLFFVGLEGNGMVYGFALNQTNGSSTKITSFPSSFPSVMELQFDRDLSELWAVCDNTCLGQHSLLRINSATGAFVTAFTFNRPTGMANLNNEGFAIAPAAECVGNRKPVSWADDGEIGGISIHSGDIPCTAFTGTESPVVPEFPMSALASVSALLLLGGIVVATRRRRPSTLAF